MFSQSFSQHLKLWHLRGWWNSNRCFIDTHSSLDDSGNEFSTRILVSLSAENYARKLTLPRAICTHTWTFFPLLLHRFIKRFRWETQKYLVHKPPALSFGEIFPRCLMKIDKQVSEYGAVNVNESTISAISLTKNIFINDLKSINSLKGFACLVSAWKNKWRRKKMQNDEMACDWIWKVIEMEFFWRDRRDWTLFESCDGWSDSENWIQKQELFWRSFFNVKIYWFP